MNRYEDRNNWKLLDTETGEEIKVGDVRSTGRNERVQITGLQPPHKPSSQGKVSVKSVQDGWSMQYYASVVGGTYEWTGGAE